MADNLLTKWKTGLERTRKSTFGKLSQLFGTTQITDETWEDLEALLIQSDIGIETTEKIMEAAWPALLQCGPELLRQVSPESPA